MSDIVIYQNTLTKQYVIFHVETDEMVKLGADTLISVDEDEKMAIIGRDKIWDAVVPIHSAPTPI